MKPLSIISVMTLCFVLSKGETAATSTKSGVDGNELAGSQPTGITAASSSSTTTTTATAAAPQTTIENISDCIDVPCKNGGTCKDGVNTYTCICAEGYNGTNCENNINDCIDMPCQNGGTCKDGVNIYTCICAQGYNGTNCENNINDCIDMPCQNGGTCKDGVNIYKCVCAEGYNGTNCENNINDCIDMPCQNGGTCKDGVNIYTCICAEGYNGTNCENNINDCIDMPCQNGGTCKDGVNIYTCICAEGYNGTNCENNFNTYTCICAEGYNGIKCENNIDECIGISCEHGGKCVDGINNYTCDCLKGYNGRHCEIAPNLPDDIRIDIHNDTVLTTEVTVQGFWSTLIEDGYSVYIKYSLDGSPKNISVEVRRTSKKISNLKSGTSYNACLYIKHYEALSDNCKQFNFTTRPKPVSEIKATNIQENHFTLTWNSANMCDKYHIDVLQNTDIVNSTFVPRMENMTIYTVNDLVSGTIYTVTIYAVANIYNSKSYSKNITTKPAKPNDVKVLKQSTTSLTLLAAYSGPEDSRLRYCTEMDSTIAPGNLTEINFCYTTPSTGNTIVLCSKNRNFTIMNLSAGKFYMFEIFTCIQGLKSNESYHGSSMTRPANEISLEIHKLGETSIDVKWTVENNEATENISIAISKNGTTVKDSWNILSRNGSTTGLFPFTNLSAGTLYTISAYAVLYGLKSEKVKKISSYTRPLSPKGVQICKIEERYFILNVDFDSKTIHNYSFIVSPENVLHNSNFTVGINELPVNITGLEVGMLYSINVYSMIAGISSEQAERICSYTKPGAIKTETIVGVPENTTSSQLYIQWGAPKGYRDNFLYNATCSCPNNNNPETLSSTTNDTHTKLSLCPGTFCNITLIVNISNHKCDGMQVLSTPSTKQISIGTEETAPGNVTNFSKHNLTHNSVLITWDAPSQKNGIIRNYEAYIRLNGTCIRKKEFQCNKTQCSGTTKDSGGNQTGECEPEIEIYDRTRSSFSWAIQGLHPYRNYIVSIFASTTESGPQVTGSVDTLEYTPGIPVNLTIKNKTSKKIDLTWQPPLERNGEVKNYTVQYKYATYMCSKKGEILTGAETIIANEQQINGIQLSGADIYPNWEYKVSVKATNNAGTGNSTPEKSLTTKESKPGKIKNDSISGGKEASPFSVKMSWNVPCDTNGKIVSYYVCLNNVSSVKRENVTWERCSFTNSTDVHNTLDIFPYRNYTFTVSAVNSAGTGIPSEAVNIQAPVGAPERPTGFAVKAVTDDTITATWNRPLLFYGPVHYFVVAQDVKNERKVFNATTSTAYWTDDITNSTNITVDEAYWEYNITAYVVSGKEKIATFSKMCRTLESTPGNVVQMTLKTEEDVTKPRILTILWKSPEEIDLNGILIEYYINLYRNLDDTNPIISDKMDNSTFSYTVEDIHPGEYRVEVFAATSKGNGSRVVKRELVKPGAPLKLNETVYNLVIQPSEKEPKDKERQIAVDLSLKDLLCNKRNGVPNRWGVIVAQDGEAKDTPFSGNVTEFDNKIKAKYKSWFEVKDMDSISPYIATRTDWKGPCVKDQRKKRDTRKSNEQDYYTFFVGLEGKCQGEKRDEYCNGELQPGRSYRVKSFACTSGGCTETEYSEPLSTANQQKTDPDLTVPIAAGISSALLVIAIVLVVVYILRRRQMACFAKDDESLRTHTSDEGIILDKIEHTKKNHFSRPGQGPIKLRDFPDAVERFHKDSDLLFADAYKLLKEKSPNHPMTAAEQQCCRPKNRYTNILPFDHSRVKLRPSDDMEGSDYINANYIPGYTSRREYIATQGPMQATFDDFWRMVWEQNVDTIVMLTKLMEKGRLKCDKYWPDLGEPVFYGDLVVSLNSESNLSDYTIKIFEIKMKEERKLVRHFSYLKWPDMGCPETPELLLEFVKAVKQYGNREKSSSGPTIVHCSAGVGRTGTFIAVDYLLQHIRDHDEVDIFNLVLEMRNHRLNMVQTEDQYIYIHECLKAFITTDEEEEEDDDEAVYVNTGFGGDEENIYANT